MKQYLYLLIVTAVLLAFATADHRRYDDDDNRNSLFKLKRKLAMRKNAGLYVSSRDVPLDLDEDLLWNLDADGGCTGQFILFDINPVNANFTRAANQVFCQWDIVDFKEDDGRPIFELIFVEYAIDPEKIALDDCVKGCYLYGIETGYFHEGTMVQNELFGALDLSLNPIKITSFGVYIGSRQTNTLFKFTFDDVKNLLSVNATIPDPCDVLP